MSWITQYSSNVSESCHCCNCRQCSSCEWEMGFTWLSIPTDATAASVPPGSGKWGLPASASPLLLAIHGITKGTKICAWSNNQILSVLNSLWRKFMQETGLQSFLQCAFWCDTWLWVKASISVSYEAHKFLVCFQFFFFIYFFLWTEKLVSHTVSPTDICIVSKSYTDILAERVLCFSYANCPSVPLVMVEGTPSNRFTGGL